MELRLNNNELFPVHVFFTTQQQTVKPEPSHAYLIMCFLHSALRIQINSDEFF